MPLSHSSMHVPGIAKLHIDGNASKPPISVFDENEIFMSLHSSFYSTQDIKTSYKNIYRKLSYLLGIKNKHTLCI